MHRKRKLLIYALLATGLAVVGLLFFTLNRGPLVTGFQAYESDTDDFASGVAITNRRISGMR